MSKKAPFLIVILFFMAIPIFSEVDPKGIGRISLPSLNWAMEIDLKGFLVKQDAISSTGENGKVCAYNPKTGLIISITLEKALGGGDSKACREYYLQKIRTTRAQLGEIQSRELKDMSLLEYMVLEYKEEKLDQENLNAYLSRGGYWISVQMAKSGYKPEEKGLFTAILNSVRFIDDYQPARMDCLKYGSTYYLAEDYQNAIRWYQKLFDLEAKDRKLSDAYWKLMVNNLGLAYVMTGNLGKSKEIFLCAIAQEKTYPMFYYNLACSYAEENDKDNAIANLEKAIKYRDNMMPGENFPDPVSDETFKKFLTDPKFQDLLKAKK
jgi:tetratricopeptide (TPR) repeat protein